MKNNIKKADIGKGLVNGMAAGVTAGAAAALVREVLNAIEDAKAEKKRRNPRTDENTVVLHIPKATEIEKPASARDDFDDAKIVDGKEIELSTPERDTAGRFAPGWISKKAQSTGTVGGLLGALLGYDYLTGFSKGVDKTKVELKNWWNNYSDDTGTILGATGGLVGGYILAKKIAQKIEEARLKREIAAAQKEYSNLLTNKNAECDLLDFGFSKEAQVAQNNTTPVDPPKPSKGIPRPPVPDPKGNGSNILIDGLSEIAGGVVKDITGPIRGGVESTGHEHGEAADEALATGVRASAGVMGATTVATIVAALAIAHVTKQILKKKYGNPNLQKDVVPRNTNVIFKASEDESFEISPATAIVALWMYKDSMAHEIYGPIERGIKLAETAADDSVVDPFAPQPAETPQQPQKLYNTPNSLPENTRLLDDPNIRTIAVQTLAQPNTFKKQLYGAYGITPKEQIPDDPSPGAMWVMGGQDYFGVPFDKVIANPALSKWLENEANAFSQFSEDNEELRKIREGLTPEAAAQANRLAALSGYMTDPNDPSSARGGFGEMFSGQIRKEIEDMRANHPEEFNAFMGDVIRSNNGLVKIMNSAEFAPAMNRMAEDRINDYLNNSWFGKATNSGWMAQLPFFNWIKQLAMWFFTKTHLGHALAMRSALGQYVDEPGKLLLGQYGNGQVYNPNIDPIEMEKGGEVFTKLSGSPLGMISEDIANLNINTDMSNVSLDEKLDTILGRLPASRQKTKRKYVSIKGDKEYQDLIKRKRKKILKILQDINEEYAEQ